MPADSETYGDPRSRLVREKFFCLRPRPLENWLWMKRIPASAERVFWLHWQEGMLRGDWCSEIPLSAVARECHVDVSTVTRAYQLLSKLGCLRRTDQGRDPANPFQQATALTEIRIPRELLIELNRYPNRRATDPVTLSQHHRQGRARANESPTASRLANPSTLDTLSTCSEISTYAATNPRGSTPPESPLTDPFKGLSGKARSQAIARLVDALSPQERHAYQEALRMHQTQMAFDPDTKVPAEDQATLCQILTSMARPSPAIDNAFPTTTVHGGGRTAPSATHRPRKLTTFELGRLSRDLQSAARTATAPELMRQVVWSIEAGALRRFDTRHALHIALKKIREGHWTRPHRMPPNWSRTLSSTPSAAGTCGHA